MAFYELLRTPSSHSPYPPLSASKALFTPFFPLAAIPSVGSDGKRGGEKSQEEIHKAQNKTQGAI